jgi:hypothetical protein
MTAGIPSKYTPELQQKFDDLIQSLYTDNDKTNYNNFWSYGIVEQIAVYLRITIETIYQWVDPRSEFYKPAFSDSFKEWFILSKAMFFKTGKVMSVRAPAAFIFLCKTKLGMIEVKKTIFEERYSQILEIDGVEDNEFDTLMNDIKEADEYGLTEDTNKLRQLIERLKNNQGFKKEAKQIGNNGNNGKKKRKVGNNGKKRKEKTKTKNNTN